MVVRRITDKVRTGPATVLLATGALCLLGGAAPASGDPIIPPSNAGGGVISAQATFVQPTGGIPPVGQGCEPSQVHVAGDAPAVVVNTVLTGYAGSVHVVADGSSTCENTEGGAGSVTVEAHGVGPTLSRLDCGPYTENPTQAKLVGDYERHGGVVIVRAQGPCTINKFAIAQVRFVATLGAVATQADFQTPDPTAGITGRAKYASMSGVFGLATL